MTVRGLTVAYIVLLILGGATGAYLVTRKPRTILTVTGDTSADSLAAYERRIGELTAQLDSIKAVLGRRGLLGRIAVRRRISQIEQQLNSLSASVRIWRSAHDQYGAGQAYRECVLLYGAVQSACQSLSYDTLPPQPDTFGLKTK